MAEARHKPTWRLDQQSARALALGTHDNPFAVLGPHDTREGRVIRAFLPGASAPGKLAKDRRCKSSTG
jgi:1,4-alpha-glucan branching enzyme